MWVIKKYILAFYKSINSGIFKICRIKYVPQEQERKGVSEHLKCFKVLVFCRRAKNRLSNDVFLEPLDLF